MKNPNELDSTKNGMVLVGREEIAHAVSELATRIDADYCGRAAELVFLCVLKGAVVFLSDLIRELKLVEPRLEFISATSYGSGMSTSGVVKIGDTVALGKLSNCDIIIIEDIIDSGLTLQKLHNTLKDNGALSVKTCALFDKPSRRQVDYNADYTGIEVPNAFVVGYGLDHNERYRNLPHLTIIKDN